MKAWLAALAIALAALSPAEAQPRPDGAGDEAVDAGDEQKDAAEVPEVAPPGPLYCPPDGACDFPFELPERANFVIAPLEGEVSLGMAAFVERIVDRLEEGDVLVLDINTFGGRVDAAVVIRDALLGVRKKGATTVAFVHPRAISAGALISLATDIIVVAPASTIGAATPVTQGEGGEMQAAEEKVVSYMRKEMRATAEARGRSGDIAEAMVDADREVPNLSAKGKLLTLDGAEALAWGIASFEADSVDELIDQLGYGEGERSFSRTDIEWSWAEKLAGWLSSAALSGILMTVGMLALMIGLYSGGAPLPLGIGAACLGIFFFGHHIVNLAGLEEVLLFIGGLVLIGVEIFFPGNIIPGVAGVLLVVASLFMGLIDLDRVPLSVQWEMGWITRALATVFGAILAAGVLVVLAVKHLPESRLGRWLVLESAVTGRASDESEAVARTLVGHRGTALTDLRPSGRVTVDGRRFDAVAEAGFIEKGAPVTVVKGRGFSLVVGPVRDEESES